MGGAAVQFNVRLDAEHKQRGDELLRRAGYSPMQLIRLLWAAFSRDDATPDMVEGVVAAVSVDGSKVEEKDRRIKLAAQGADYMASQLAGLGFSTTSLPGDTEFGELRDEIANERYGACEL